MYTKLTIKAYADEEYTKPVGGLYTALINPEGLSVDLKVELNQDNQGQGQANAPATYVRTPAQTMNFDLLFDATGVIEGGPAPLSSGDVSQQVEDFIKMAFTVTGENHQPNHLMIVYGTTLFKGRLEGVSVNYKLFDTNAKPLRAVVKCTFRASKTEKITDSFSMPSSPDLTHMRIVKQGDTLPLLCHTIYDDSAYYIQVAAVNGLSNFRNLKPGTTLFFPPLKK